MRRWIPDRVRANYGQPTPGDVIAYDHAVWHVTAVANVDLDDDARQVWVEAGMPDLDTWRGRPYEVTVSWLGGARLDGMESPDDNEGFLEIPAGRWITWYVYTDGRWPQCSCCGEPMPCRAARQDDEVERSLAKVAKLESILPGCCWACHEPITSRQKAVTYHGDNLDLPGAASPRFHTRQGCRSTAAKYEDRWTALDPRRERILTYPTCNGILSVHADGSSECSTGRSPLGAVATHQNGCRGHLTHDHNVHRACYVGENYFGQHDGSACERGCSRIGHPGTRTTRRPERRPSIADPGLPIETGGAS